MKFILTYLLLLLSLSSFSQDSNWAFRFETGYQKLPSSNTYDPVFIFENFYKFIPTKTFVFGVGTELDVEISSNVYFSTGLSLFRILGREEKERLDGSDISGTVFDRIELTENEINELRFALPLKIKVKNKKFTYSLGVEISRILKSNLEHYFEVRNIADGMILFSNSAVDRLEYKRFNIGPLVGSEFKFNEQTGIYISMFFSINNIAKHLPKRDNDSWSQKNYRITLGAYYSI